MRPGLEQREKEEAQPEEARAAHLIPAPQRKQALAAEAELVQAVAAAPARDAARDIHP
jgi:hypothetical protein